MTIEEMKQFIKKNINFNELKKNKGIYEFIIENNKSIGISYEDIDDKKDVFIYNLFVNNEYVNINGEGTKENPLPDNILKELTQEFNKYS